MKLNFYSKHGRIEYIILGAITWIILFLGFYIIDYNETSAAEFLRTHLEQPPLNPSELKEIIKLNIDNLNEVNIESFEILTNQLAKDNSNIYYIQSYKNNRGNTLYTLTPLSLEFDIEFDSLQPKFSPSYENLSISTQFFKDNKQVYFLHNDIRYSHSNSIFEPLQNVSINSWRIINDSKEFSFDEYYFYYGSTILSNITSQNPLYLENSYIYYNNIFYFKNNPLIMIENLSLFENIFEDMRYKILLLNDSIWIHQVTPQRNIFLQNISNASSFKYVGRYNENEQLFEKLEIGPFHDLFEDSHNYYSLLPARLPLTSSTFGVRRVNYLEEMEIVQYFEIYPKE